MAKVILDGPDSSEEKRPDDWKDNEGDVCDDEVDVSPPLKEKPPPHDLNDK